jgi:hypothetical protein
MAQEQDSLGRYQGIRKTFSTSFQLVAPANANAFVTITAAATGTFRNLRLKRIRINGVTLTAAQLLRIALRKYTTQPTGGTFTAATAIAHRTESETSTAVINTYTVAPAGGLGSPVTLEELNISGLATGAVTSSELLVDYDTNRAQLPAVIGSTECLGIAFLAAPATAVTLSVSLTWTEDGN